MAINFYTVSNHLESEGWKLVSTEYKNLNTELEMICPHGHKQIITYGSWRKQPICEICLAGDTTKAKKNKISLKGPDTIRVLALDAATSISGYAVYDDNVLVSYGTFKANKDSNATARINEIKKWLLDFLQKNEVDFLGLENIQLQNVRGGRMSVEVYKTLANLQGVLLDAAFETCIDYALAYPSEWRKYCGISEGDAHRENKKKQAQDKVKMWYDLNCTQDEADAICMGKYFIHLLKKNNTSHWGEEL